MIRIALVAVIAVFAIGAVTLSKGCASTHENRNPVGEVFPSVVGKSLEKEEFRIPEDLAGEPAVLLVGYVQQTQFDIDRWILGLLQADIPARIIEVPTIPGLAPPMFSRWLDEGMRSGIPEADWGSVVTLYGSDADPVAELTGNQNKRNTRALVLDQEGRIVWFADEGYSARLALEVKRLTERLIEEPETEPEE